MRASRLQLVKASPANAKHFMGHLFPVANAAVKPLTDLLPGPDDGTDEAYRFLSFVYEELSALNGAPKAWRLLAHNDPLLRHFACDQPVVAPIVRGWKYDRTAHLSLKERTFQTVEATLALFLDAEGKMTALAPVASVSASRFPFYAPNVPGFVADLASFGAIVVGDKIPVADLPRGFEDVGVVLSIGGEPRSVGYARNCVGGSFRACITEATKQAQRIGGPSALVGVLTSGTLASASARPGEFTVNFGPLGKVNVSFE